MKRMLARALGLFVYALVTASWLPSASAQQPDPDRPVYDTANDTYITVAQMMEQLAGVDVVYVGESHTDYAHHLAQLEVLKYLRAHNPRLVMGWEMFHATQQPLLDAYSEGLLEEPEWLDAIYWQETWGHPYPYYKPLLDYLHENNVRFFGLNVPREIVRAARIEGETGMTPEQLWWLPGGFWTRVNIPEEEQYKEWFFEIARHGPQADDAFMEGMFASQTVWNEVMGWNTVKPFNIIPYPDVQVLVVVGSGHVIFREGIPTRVARFREGTTQLVVMPKTSADVMTRAQIREEGMEAEGDFLWFVPPAGDPPGLERSEPEGPPPPGEGR